jgi:hypothetical protein
MMMEVGDRGIFNVGDETFYGRVVKIEGDYAQIESFTSDLQKKNYVTKNIEYASLRGGAAAARDAHNVKVAGSTPAPAIHP